MRGGEREHPVASLEEAHLCSKLGHWDVTAIASDEAEQK